MKSNDGVEWVMTAAYAHPNPRIGKFLWDKLNEVEVSRPWMLIGDFNCLLKEEERRSNSGASSSFRSWMEFSGLLDVGFSRSRFA